MSPSQQFLEKHAVTGLDKPSVMEVRHVLKVLFKGKIEENAQIIC